MRIVATIAAIILLLSAPACSGPQELTQAPSTDDGSVAKGAGSSINKGSSSAIYLECEAEDVRATERVIIYRIDPLEGTWSWWIDTEEDGGPDWQVISCDIDEDACEFEETKFSLHVGLGVLGGATINRVTGKMTKRTYSNANRISELPYMCSPVENPVSALAKKF